MNDYEKYGVSVTANDDFVNCLTRITKNTHDDNVISGVGGFCSLYAIPNSTNNLVIATSVDGIGTKLILSTEIKNSNKFYDNWFNYTHSTDLIAMVFNDIITCGAVDNLILLDYYAVSSLSEKMRISLDFMQTLSSTCAIYKINFIGGETAEMSDLLAKKDYFDICGFGIGMVNKPNIYGKQRVNDDDVLIGIYSNGFHSNGYTLIRNIFKNYDWVADELNIKYDIVQPTYIYINLIKALIEKFPDEIHAMANITGGGLYNNTKRVIKDNQDLIIHWDSWKTQKIFNIVKTQGNIDEETFRNTFNSGIGYVLIVNKNSVESILNTLNYYHWKSSVIGVVIKNKGD